MLLNRVYFHLHAQNFTTSLENICGMSRFIDKFRNVFAELTVFRKQDFSYFVYKRFLNQIFHFSRHNLHQSVFLVFSIKSQVQDEVIAKYDYIFWERQN